MRYLVYMFWLLLIMLGISFSALNAENVHLDYYIGDTNIFLPLLLIILLLIGILLGFLLFSRPLLSLKLQNRHLKHQLKGIESELAHIRTTLSPKDSY